MQSEQREIEKLQRKVAQLSGLYSISAGIGLTETPDKVLEYVLDKAVSILRAEIGAILLSNEQEGRLSLKYTCGLNRKLIEHIEIRFGQGLLGQVVQSGNMMKVNNLQDKRELIDTFIKEYPVQSAICLPIKRKNKTVGVIYVGRFSNLEFLQDEQWLLTILGNRASVALESAELYCKLRMTVASERERAAELEKAYRELENANKELNDFAYVVSHDLKAPLRGIKTLAQWITTDYADRLDENGRGQLNLLLSRADRMHNLIDGVLQYSRVGRVKENKVQINLNELVSEVIDMVAPPENISITVENELPVIEFERTRIAQVFQNLLSNAVKFMDKPEGQVRIGCVAEDGWWKFSVTDNGPGIEEKYFEKIFQLFQTLSPRDEVESTGVGLTVVKKIIEMYGGRIWVESKVGQGSTFLFTLPKHKVRIENAELQASIIS
jgi:signal transduction histidine kinase